MLLLHTLCSQDMAAPVQTVVVGEGRPGLEDIRSRRVGQWVGGMQGPDWTLEVGNHHNPR